jgi:hypothetical protein
LEPQESENLEKWGTIHIKKWRRSIFKSHACGHSNSNNFDQKEVETS